MVVVKKRVLIIKTRAIGDTLLTTGPIRVLKERWPMAEIHVLVRSPAGELLENNPNIYRIISVKEPKSKYARAKHWFSQLYALRELQYDLVLNFHASLRSSLVARLLRAKVCVANHHELQGINWFSERAVPGRGVVKAIIDRDLDVLRAIDIDTHINEALPEVYLTDFEKQKAHLLLANQKQNYSGPMIFLGIGGSRATKRWPAAHFVQLLEKLTKELDASFVLSTVDSDEFWLHDFYAALKGSEQYEALLKRITHFRDSSLRDVAGLLSQSDCYIGNDSGLKHLAAAVGTKTFTVFGPEQPLEWHPYDTGRHSFAYIDDLKCRTEQGKHWCSISTCTVHSHQCMLKIDPTMVYDQVVKVLKC